MTTTEVAGPPFGFRLAQAALRSRDARRRESICTQWSICMVVSWQSPGKRSSEKGADIAPSQVLALALQRCSQARIHHMSPILSGYPRLCWGSGVQTQLLHWVVEFTTGPVMTTYSDAVCNSRLKRNRRSPPGGGFRKTSVFSVPGFRHRLSRARHVDDRRHRTTSSEHLHAGRHLSLHRLSAQQRLLCAPRRLVGAVPEAGAVLHGGVALEECRGGPCAQNAIVV